MATLPARELKIGKIIDKTLALIEQNGGRSLIYLVAVTAVCVPVSYFAVGSMSPSRLAGAEFLKSAVGIVFGYFLIVPMVRKAGLFSRPDGDVFLPYIGLTILSSLGVMLGVLAFVIPGLFIMARWIIAPALLVARKTGVMEALGESWDRTRGSEFAIIAAGLALLLLPIAVAIAAMILFEEGDLVRIIISQLASSASSVLLLAMGVAVYGMIVRAGNAATSPG